MTMPDPMLPPPLPSPSPVSLPASRAPRDVRLDFFRGLAMFIIFIAHLPGNSWFDWIPARFGFSSAAELFVFCSGLASAFAFGRVFVRDGWLAGARRIAFRIWQVYWAHIGLALVLIAISVGAFNLTGGDYPIRIGLGWLLANPGEGFLKLMTLRFMPNYVDILPMYLVLLAMVPLVVALAHVHPRLMMASLLALWGGVQITEMNLPGGVEPGMGWFLNPFAWQLVFFTGFSFGMGWLKAPALGTGALFWICVAMLLMSVPVNFWAFTEAFPTLEHIHDMLISPTGKTNLNPLLYIHFMASAYVVLSLIEPVRNRLSEIRPVILVGQQALATFLASIALAWTGGVMLDLVGRDSLTTGIANLLGIILLICVAKTAEIYKGGASSQAVKGARVMSPAPAKVVPFARSQPAE